MRLALAVAACAASVAAPAGVAGGFPTGQCTNWAFLMRPDIVADTTLANASITDWNAYRWAANAVAGGFTVGARPAVGAIAVWPPNTLGAGSVGHVAYVEQVRSDGSFYVSEKDYNGSPLVHRRWVQPSSAIQFIYLKPGESPPSGPIQSGGRLESLHSSGGYSATGLAGTNFVVTVDAPVTVALRLTGPNVDRRVTWSFRAGGWNVSLDKIAGATALPPGNYKLTAFAFNPDLGWRWVSFHLA